MKKHILNLIFLCTALTLTAQHDHLHPCGTPAVKSEWLTKFQKNPSAYETSRDDLIYVPISVKVVGDDDGRFYASGILLQGALCTLNEDFLDAKLHFYLGELEYINDDRYYAHETVEEGYAMMQEYDNPDMINCYFMQDAAGNCGYNLPSAGMCVSLNCAGPGDHTWAHEMGHQLSLPHPFLGWEGGQGFAGAPQNSWSEPSPETVLYNYTSFKETFYTDTMIIDTAFVELMDGSNCEIAADGFCDTKPDYLAYRWVCNNENNSNTEQIDPNGVTFISDGSLIMSYAQDNCSSRFTPDQIAASRAYLMDKKGHVLGNENPVEPVTATEITGASPTDFEDVFPEDIEITWDPIEGATMYLVQLSFLENFGIPIYDVISNTNSTVIPSLQFPNREHYYRIKAFNDYHFCGEWMEGGSFNPNESVATEDQLATNWKVFPTVIRGERYLNIHTPEASDVAINIYDANGKLHVSEQLRQTESTIDTEALVSGLYVVHLKGAGVYLTEKIVIQ